MIEWQQLVEQQNGMKATKNMKYSVKINKMKRLFNKNCRMLMQNLKY